MDNDLIQLNVGGTRYATTRKVLLKDSKSRLADWFKNTNTNDLPKDDQNQYFIDRDGLLFRFILDFLRADVLILPDKFPERKRLLCEAQFYNLNSLISELSEGKNYQLSASSTNQKLKFPPILGQTTRSGYITVGYQGTFYFGPQGLPATDINFRKIMRILVAGRVSLCREVFKETLNEARDPDRGHSYDRYTSRFYLKHNIIEQAFDMLADANFALVSSCASGTAGSHETKPSSNTEEDRWAHYSEFIFYR
uniref:Potassium channel tetramerisation-type BTB domain-containing protein n=1 Tax=Romanomermis culicivorax TaxID=13658 RepID=A0A915KRE5_ROMCU